MYAFVVVLFPAPDIHIWGRNLEENASSEVKVPVYYSQTVGLRKFVIQFA
jgi:hypothetical protein